MTETLRTAPSPSILLWERVMPQDPSVEWLRGLGFDVRVGRPTREPAYRRQEPADFIADARDCAAVLVSGGIRITRELMHALPDLRVISKIGVGVDTIDVNAATDLGIAVCNTPGGNDSVFVAEHAMALMLALRKQLHIWTRERLRQGGWREPSTFSVPLDGATVGIVGFGRIGRALAQRLAGWNVQVLAYDPMTQQLPAGVRAATLDELLAQSDVVSLHCPAPPDGRPLLDEARLALMKPSAILVNTARATLVDGGALTSALDAGALAGAAVDVFEPEPPRTDDPLLAHPKVLCTPHVASWTWQGFFGRRQQAAENIAALLRNGTGASVVNRVG